MQSNCQQSFSYRGPEINEFELSNQKFLSLDKNLFNNFQNIYQIIFPAIECQKVLISELKANSAFTDDGISLDAYKLCSFFFHLLVGQLSIQPPSAHSAEK